MSKETGTGDLVRSLDWKGAFWVAAGVPPLVLFSIGGIAGVAGQAAFVVWILSMIMGFLQSFTYAEMAGMFGNKSGGTSVYGATAWLRYSKLIAPLVGVVQLVCLVARAVAGLCHCGGIYSERAVPDPAGRQRRWCWIGLRQTLPAIPTNTPVVVRLYRGQRGHGACRCDYGRGIADGVAALTPAFRVWEAYALNIPGLGALHFNSTFVIGVVLMLIMLAIQHRGIASTASAQKLLAVIVLVPLLLVGLVPILTGAINTMNVTGIVPPTAAYSGVDGEWNVGGWTLFLGRHVYRGVVDLWV